MNVPLFRAALSVLLALAAGATAAAPAYTLVDLGANTTGDAINARGEVIGQDVSVPFGAQRIWRDGVWRPLQSILGGGEVSSLDNHDVAAGWSELGPVPTAVMWTRKGHLVDLSKQLPDGAWSQAEGVTADGTVVGWSFVDGVGFRPFTVRDGVLTNLDCPADTQGCDARGASPNAILAGSLYKRNRTPAALWVNGAWRTLGTLGGSVASAWAVNRSGHAVGQSWRTGDAQQSAFFHADRQMVDLGLVGGWASAATGINEADTVVGKAWTDPNNGGITQGFVWQDGQAWRLADVVVGLPPTWSLERASGINDAGWIVGTGTADGQVHGFVLKPATP